MTDDWQEARPGWRDVATVARALAPRPDLWRTAVAAVFRLAGPRWWAAPPFLPFPDRRYWGFRLLTALGGPGTTNDQATAGVTAPPRRLSGEDVVAYLQWCRRTPAAGG